MLLFLLALVLGFGEVLGQSTGRDKVALLVGISNYPVTSGWDSLHARRDVEAVTTVLQRQGFNDLRVLEDGAATKQEVVEAITGMNPPFGASVVLFFSMHGQQLPDDADADYEPDGQDEALALYGAPSEFPSTYHGEQHLRDDELRGLLDLLRAKVGSRGEVVLLVDACYSGTIDRGPGDYWAPIRSSGAVTKNAQTRLEGTGIVDSVSARGSVSEKGKLGALTVITGSRADEQSREVLNEKEVYMGSLSWAFCKGMEASGPSTTYRGLFQHIQRYMIQGLCASQPQLHGDPDRLLFQGRAVERAQQIAVLQALGGDTVLVDMGTIGGLSVGSRVGLFPRETRSPSVAAQLAEGQVVAATTFRAKVVWERAVGMDSLREGWVLVTERHYDRLRPRVKLDCGGEGICAMAAVELRESEIVELVGDQPELLLSGGRGFVVLQSELGDTLYDSRKERGDADHLVLLLRIRLVKCLQAKCILATEFEDTRYRIDPFVALASDSLHLGPLTEFKMGDHFLVGGVHHGSRPAYYNIVYVEKWKASLLAPWDCGSSDQLLVQPGAHFVVDVPFQFTAERSPYRGIFKLIATEEPLNLCGIIDKVDEVRGNDPRKYSPLEWMLRCFVKDRLRRSMGMNLEMDLTRACSVEIGIEVSR